MARHRRFGAWWLRSPIRSRMHAATHQAWSAQLRAGRRNAVANAAWQVMLAVGYAAAVGLLLWQAVDGRATPGDVVAAVYLCRQVASLIVEPIFNVGLLGPMLRTTRRLLWLHDYAAHAQSLSGDSAPPARLHDGIVMSDLNFAYPGTTRSVLEHVSLRIPAGSVLALVGDNGAGKTTLIKLLTRMYEPTSGRILVDGVDLADIDVSGWRRRLSATFQDFLRPELEAVEAIGIGDLPRLRDEVAVLAALDRAGGADVVAALSASLATQLGATWDDGAELSTGQWQKVALARGLMRNDPLLVIFDEPTASLDAQTEHAVFTHYADAARRQSAANAITVLVSHRFTTVRSADLIAVLADGRLVEVGGHDELMRNGGTYAELYSIQAKSYEIG